MSVRARDRTPSPHSFERARAVISARLRARRAEIEAAVLARASAISDPAESHDPEYLEGLRTTISDAVDYGLAAIERGEDHKPSLPPTLLAQARLAARNGVGLDTVLRRYSAGYVLLSDFLIEEAEHSNLRGGVLRRLLRAQAALDRLLAAVSEEYAREERERPGTRDQRRAERIERLLAGEQLDTSGLDYDFEGFHLGVIGAGPGAWKALRGLAIALDCRLLALRRGEGTVWAWLGSRQMIDDEDLRRHVSANWPVGASLAIGEPGAGIPDWRLTHHQAKAALAIALRSPEPLVRYADVALMASVVRDDLLAASLHRLYLGPLKAEHSGGKVACDTLRAYFSAERNISSAAAALGVNRNTVASRLRTIEATIGRPLNTCGPELETALRLAELGDHGISPVDPALR
jgi:PucR C-terminal helix-turn-helix domain/GGDEF-like domain